MPQRDLIGLCVSGGTNNSARRPQRSHFNRIPALLRPQTETARRVARVVQTVRRGEAACDAARLNVAALLRLRLAHGDPQRHPLRAQSQLIHLPGEKIEKPGKGLLF